MSSLSATWGAEPADASADAEHSQSVVAKVSLHQARAVHDLGRQSARSFNMVPIVCYMSHYLCMQA